MNEETGIKIAQRKHVVVSIARSILGYVQRFLQKDNGGNTVRGALEELIEDHPHSATPIVDEQRTLLENILNLRDRTIADVMVPRADIIGINANATLEQIIVLINEEAHSRVPVFQEALDDAIGMIHIKDVLSAQQKKGLINLHEIVRPVLFVTPSMQVLELLLEMRAKRTHMALVVDEFGGVDGLLTIEDLVEEIVGEIEDEHDLDDEPTWRVRTDGAIDADARLEIFHFEQVVGLFVTDEEREELDTLGGLVFSLAGRVPVRGELVKHSSGVEIEIVDADPRRVKHLRIHNLTSENYDPNLK
ncbi:MAG: hemolysin family protein [Rhodospirillales bacterium]|nr:hemolysin family protein [Rhodospirillales bacterium]